jgi:serine/threonine-protein kinase
VDVRGLLDVLCACCVCALVALGANAAAAGYDDDDDDEARYGAIAYSPSTRSHGWAYDYSSRREADHRALGRCGRFAGDCTITVRFRNACGALAVGFDGYGSGWGTSRKLAERYALQSCGRYSGGCSVVRWACTTPRR